MDLALALFPNQRPREEWEMPEYVVYRGVQMSEDWPEQIRAAQTKTTLVIDGKTIRRIPYGRERGWGPGHDRRPCHDCCAVSGELHPFHPGPVEVVEL